MDAKELGRKMCKGASVNDCLKRCALRGRCQVADAVYELKLKKYPTSMQSEQAGREWMEMCSEKSRER